eukprot:TRINITY_DN29549_c0_g2_i3.p1 TRINITY_DN29549_c0_g2~~TRINITY_DN29549_c0_g2_i3.p1  ORF type:complete len:756 (-),score=91.00 TRINITY_DN29549_c0_g2_i3:381-2408(-)
MYTFKKPASPHSAAKLENTMIADEQVIHSIIQEMEANDQINQFLIETAGGPASPTISGSLQADMYSYLKFPGVLVGSCMLGGISQTISAFEVLSSRGHEIPLILTMESQELDNLHYLQGYFEQRGNQYIQVMGVGYEINPVENINEWLEKNDDKFKAAYEYLQEWSLHRQKSLQSSIERGMKKIWWPFTQHGITDPQNVNFIDGRSGDFFSIQNVNQIDQNVSSKQVVQQQYLYDGSASWWTQGLNQDPLNQELVKAITYAAGRYGHVIFPGNIHQPALEVTEKLLDIVGKNWATRVFFSDNGSTAVEVALKMAFRKYSYDRGIKVTPKDLKAIVIEGNYHGDTLGAMDCQEEGDFTGPMQTPWYVDRSLTLKPYLVGIQQGKYRLFSTDDSIPPEVENEVFENQDELFSEQRMSSKLAGSYEEAVKKQIEQHGDQIGACIIEPVMQGAGGMNFVDPLYQKVLLKICRERRIPVIFDEVFTGLWRLGAPSAADLLDTKPDIACYAKLLTGGMLPMAVTLSTEDVYTAFLGESKISALLHGHSYTAHPIGCQVASRTLDLLSNPQFNQNITDCQSKRMRNMWDDEKVKSLSSSQRISKVVSIGCVLAASLKSDAGEASGYHGNKAQRVIKNLRHAGIHARPLGNTVYLMCTPVTSKKMCDWLLEELVKAIESNHQE